MSDITSDWCVNNNPVKPTTTKIPTKHFKRLHRLGTMMLNKLYGQNDCQYSKLEWFPILNCIINNGIVFNWIDILSTRLQAQFRKTHNFVPSSAEGFHLSSYLVDAICAFTPFPLMNWNFSSLWGPIHTYCSYLSAVIFMDYFDHICDNFLVPLHTLLFGYPPPRFLESTVSTLKEIVDWYVFEKYSYIRVYGCQDSPHTHPTFILNRFLLKEIAYQTVSTSRTKVLKVIGRVSGYHFQLKLDPINWKMQNMPIRNFLL